jgi:hypothetical protein
MRVFSMPILMTMLVWLGRTEHLGRQARRSANGHTRCGRRNACPAAQRTGRGTRHTPGQRVGRHHLQGHRDHLGGAFRRQSAGARRRSAGRDDQCRGTGAARRGQRAGARGRAAVQPCQARWWPSVRPPNPCSTSASAISTPHAPCSPPSSRVWPTASSKRPFDGVLGLRNSQHRVPWSHRVI